AHGRLVVREVLDLAGGGEHRVGDVNVAEAAADVHVLAHGAPDQSALAAELRRRVHDLLHPVDVPREAGDDHTAVATRHRLLEMRPDTRLRVRDPGARDVGGVAA